jgi:hypothetical protein
LTFTFSQPQSDYKFFCLYFASARQHSLADPALLAYTKSINNQSINPPILTNNKSPQKKQNKNIPIVCTNNNRANTAQKITATSSHTLLLQVQVAESILQIIIELKLKE